jgi:hypothetical protein
MRDGLDAARALLPGLRLEPVARLGGGERSLVHRVPAVDGDGRRSSLIVKQYLSAGEGWVRETAALSVLPRSPWAPRLLADCATPPLLVIEDLGTGASVADALLAADPAAATGAVIAWAEAVAALHVATRDSRDAFGAALAARQGELPVGASLIPVYLDDAVRALDRECGALGVRPPDDALDDLHGLTKRLGGSRTAALTPADTCPNNNVRGPDGVGLIDFELAEWRHLAWDVAYLRVPWPTCWCSWRIPDDVAARAVDAYRRVAADAFPEVADPAFAHDVEAAVIGWALITTTWFIDNALGSDPPLHPSRPTPTRRAMILHRLDQAARSSELPALAELSRRLAAALRDRWGDAPLPLARAFRAPQ